MIIQLHQNLINKIAAGEVVERPASVLKELLENAIDAKATKIHIKVEDDGTKLIEISDNGTGMSREDAEIACDSHTTSKITTLEDLEQIATMGFRGEALASISAVSKMTLQTKDAKSDIGVQITVDYGKKSKSEDIASEKGTTIRVEQLFHKIPARKKFLKTAQTEYKHILQTFLYYAMAFPHVHFIFERNRKPVYNLPSVTEENFNEELRGRLADLFPKEVSENLVPVTYNSPYVTITGLAGHPSTARRTRSHQYLFLNKRPISDKVIARAIYDAFHGMIPKEQHPQYFIFLQINPQKVDVNVHPRKTEVRFDNSQQIYSAVRQGVSQSLLSKVQKETKDAFSGYMKKTTQFPSKSTYQSPQREYRSEGSQVKKSIDFTQELLQTSKVSDQTASYEIRTTPRAFQVFKNFIIIEKGEDVIIIDQHAAAERVTFEKIQQQFNEKSVEQQNLLLGETIELDAVEFDVLKKHRKKLDKLGLSLSIFGKKAMKVDAIPAILADGNIQQMVHEVIDDLKNIEESANFDTFSETVEKIVATMACHSSIRAGMALKQPEIDNLVTNLLSCKNPHSCPHGRPIMWKISKYELEKKFKRH